MHVLQQITKKSREFGIVVHLPFVDFKQAFNRVNKRELIEAMKEMGTNEVNQISQDDIR